MSHLSWQGGHFLELVQIVLPPSSNTEDSLAVVSQSPQELTCVVSLTSRWTTEDEHISHRHNSPGMPERVHRQGVVRGAFEDPTGLRRGV